jgi:protein involved in polysaccharide export with SLBB domain
MMRIPVLSMALKRLCLILMSLLLSVGAVAQTSAQNSLDALKGLSPEQQRALLDTMRGSSGTGTGKKTDPSLSMPETVQPPVDLLRERQELQKTVDGRLLRQPNEDPELRPDDSVLIQLTPVEEPDCSSSSVNASRNSGNPLTGNGVQQAAGGAPVAIAGLAPLGASFVNGNAGASDTKGNGTQQSSGSSVKTLCDRLAMEKPKTSMEKDQQENFRKRVLADNPYRLNRFGVLEIPGLQSVPLAGLTAGEAAARLAADPDLSAYQVKITLLRLQPSGEEALKAFGYDLFEGVPSTFAPVSDIQVPTDYIVGPGDTLEVQLYGNEPSTYSLTVERDGRINFPKLGPIMVSGMTFDAARETIQSRVAQQLIGSRVSVTMGNLRSIRVFVLGEANKPGSYTVSGLSTMTNALFVSGGVKKIGSLRTIELKRNGRLITVLDLYDLLLHGDTSGDHQLLPGDVIFIPPVGNTVSVSGAVRRPAIYELRGEKSVGQVVDLAGGLAPDADQKLVHLERIRPSRSREIQDVDLTTVQGREFALANGDKVRVPAIKPTLENSVTLSGYVFRPGSFEYRAGLRLSDVLPSFDELRPNADLHYIMVRRQMPPEEKVEVVSADLERALAARGSAADPELQPRDEVIVFDLSAHRDRLLAPLIETLELQATPEKPEQVVSIGGRVKAPGRYPLEPDMHVSDLIRAGGSLEDAAYRSEAELTRYAIVDGNARQTELIPVNLAAILHGDPMANLALKPYDVLVIKPIAKWKEPGSIELAGEVRFPGRYPIHQGETLYSVLQRAGGLTDIAFAEGAVFIREDLRKREKEQIELLSNRLQTDLAALSLQAVASSAVTANSGGAAGASQALVVGQQLLAQLRDAEPVGRLVIDVDQVLGHQGSPGDVLLKDGDRLLVPKRTQEVTILGEVQSPTSHIYRDNLTREDYIALSGGMTQRADRKRIYVVRANGDVISGSRAGWFRKSRNLNMRPGDTIVVPLDTERINALPVWQAVTTIIYNLAVAVLAIHSA